MGKLTAKKKAKVLEFRLPLMDMYIVRWKSGLYKGSFQIDTKTERLASYTDSLFDLLGYTNKEAKDVFIERLQDKGFVVEQIITRRNEGLPCTVKHQA